MITIGFTFHSVCELLSIIFYDAELPKSSWQIEPMNSQMEPNDWMEEINEVTGYNDDSRVFFPYH